MRVANKDARNYVERRLNFQGSNTYGEGKGAWKYVVYSYGYHYPMFICVEDNGLLHWYENKDRYSRSTSKHHSQLRPYNGQITLLSTAEMNALLSNAIEVAI